MTIVVLFFLGMCFGSFINALVWRLKQQADGHKSQRYSITRGRSICPKCHHVLSALDLIPLVSWLLLRGKCRYCHKKISIQYPLVELAVAMLFVVSYYAQDYPNIALMWLNLPIWYVCLVLLVALAVYDARWMILPNQLVYLLSGVSFLYLLVWSIAAGSALVLVNGLLGALALGGLFYALFYISKETWIGGGDVKLAIPIGFLVGSVFNVFIVLFTASLLGTIYALPLLIKGKARKAHIPFGPFLIAATIIVSLYGSQINSFIQYDLLGL